MFNKIDLFDWATLNKIQLILAKLVYSHELAVLAIGLVLIGIIGFIESQEFLSVLINIEIIMICINFYLVVISLLMGNFFGQMYALCFLAITAAETAIGLGLLILLYRARGRINFIEFSTLRG